MSPSLVQQRLPAEEENEAVVHLPPSPPPLHQLHWPGPARPGTRGRTDDALVDKVRVGIDEWVPRGKGPLGEGAGGWIQIRCPYNTHGLTVGAPEKGDSGPLWERCPGRGQIPNTMPFTTPIGSLWVHRRKDFTQFIGGAGAAKFKYDALHTHGPTQTPSTRAYVHQAPKGRTACKG